MNFHGTKINSKLYGSIFFMMLLLIAGSAQYSFAMPKFSSPSNSPIAATYNNVDIKANGSNVYVAFTDATTNLGVVASADNGTTFPNVSSIFACVVCSLAEADPQLAVSGKYLYVTWLDGDGKIAFARSDNSGATFAGVSPTQLTTTGNQLPPHIATYGNNVYIQWIDNTGKVAFIASHNNGASWDSIQVISSTSQIFDPQIATSGNNAYVTWEDKNIESSGDIVTRVISSNGTVLGGTVDLSNTTGQASDKPQIAAVNSRVYQVWQESYNPTNADVFFASSTNNATTFGNKVNLSHSGGVADHPQISADSNNVYIAWQDTILANKNEILFKTSHDNGTTFSNAANLSSNSGDSLFPKMATYSNNVFVVWQDRTIDSTGDVLFKASSDNGNTFGGLKKLNSNTNTIHDNTATVSPSQKNVSVVWSDSSNNAYYISAVQSPIEVQFSASQYALNSTATVIVTDPAANTSPVTNQTISINVKSTTDSTGIAALSLAETGINTGIFSGTFTFSSNTTSGTALQATPGDVITGTYLGQSSVASIFPIIISFDSPSGYDRGAFAHLTVTDPDSNIDPNVREKILVHVKSIANPAGIDLQLNETGVNTGIFGGSGNNKLIFMEKNYLFSPSSTLTINQTNTGANANPNTIESLVEQVNSTSDMAGILMNLNETSANSGQFSGKLGFTSSPSVNHVSIHVLPGDFFSITRGTATANGMITPNSNPSHGALLVTPDPTVDTVTASFRGVAKSVPVSRLFDPGGSGGGLVRPGMILDVVAGLSGGGNNPVPPMFSLAALAQTAGTLPEDIRQQVLKHDPNKPLTPQYGSTFDYPLIIDGGGYVLGGYQNTITTITEKAGNPISLKLNLPATNLVHLALYANLAGKQREITDSDTYVVYDKGQSLQKIDPHGLFSSIKFDLTTQGVYNKIQYTITFAKELPKSDIIFRAWNDRESSADVKLHDVLEVQGPQVTSSSLSQTLDNSSQPLAIVPAQAAPQNMSNNNMLDTIKDWGGFSSHPISDSEFLSHIGLTGKSIPKWVTSTTKYVVNNDMTEQDFENLVKYLASNGIIK